MSLRTIRVSRDVSQEELANYLGVSIPTISRYEHGICKPSAGRAKKIAEYLNVSVDEILDNKVCAKKSFSTRLGNNSNRYRLQSEYSHTTSEYFAEHEVLARANGHCELCGNGAPFQYPDGTPYFVFQKVQPAGLFAPNNLVALCPNCAARLDTLRRAEDIETIKAAANKCIPE